MTVVPAQQTGGGGGSSGLYDVLELVLDRGLVIDAFVRVSLVGIEILKIDVRVVVASVDTYLRFAEAVNRLDLQPRGQVTGLPGLTESITQGVSESKTKGVLSGAKESAKDVLSSLTGKDKDEEEEEKEPARRSSRSRKSSGEG